MTQRELVVLGSAAQVPTRTRNHNGYLLRWDDEVLLFDPGEGTQRQMTFAGRSVAKLTRVCITHFHGDHCLGLPGVIQRRSLDASVAPLDVHFPAEGAEFFDHLRHAAAFAERSHVRGHPCTGGTVVARAGFTLSAAPLVHRVPTLGWRIDEPDGVRLVPERLAVFGLQGPIVGRLQRDGWVDVDGRRVTLADVGVPRRGQAFAFVMDTDLCDAAFGLADGVDLLVCESTFLEADAALAREYRHLTAADAGRIAAAAGVGRLVLTHFSQRYGDPEAFRREAATHYDGDVVVAEDLLSVAVPART